MKPAVQDLIPWIETQVRHGYGTINIELKVRGGEITYIRRGFVEGISLDTPGGTGRYDTHRR